MDTLRPILLYWNNKYPLNSIFFVRFVTACKRLVALKFSHLFTKNSLSGEVFESIFILKLHWIWHISIDHHLLRIKRHMTKSWQSYECSLCLYMRLNRFRHLEMLHLIWIIVKVNNFQFMLRTLIENKWSWLSLVILSH